MSNSADQVLDILIRMGYIGAEQAEAARADLAKVKGEVGDMNTHLPEGAALWAKYKNVMGESGKEALSHREATRLLSMSLKEMGAGIPEAGHLLHMLFNPATAGFAIGMAALTMYFSHQEKIEEKYKEMIVSAMKVNDAMREMVHAGGTTEEHIVSMANAMAEYKEHANGAARELDEMELKARMFADHQRAVNEAAKSGESAQNALIAARIQLLKDSGSISDTQAEQLKTMLKYREEEQKRDEEKKALQEKISENARRDELLLHQQVSLPRPGEAQENFERASSTSKRNEDVLTKTPELIKTINEQIAEAKTTRESLIKNNLFGVNFGQINNTTELIKSLEATKERLGGIYDQAKASEGKDADALAAAKGQLDASKKVADEQKKNTDEMTALQAQLAALNSRQSSERGASSQQSAMDQTVNRVQGGKSVDQIMSEGVAGMATIQKLIDQGMNLGGIEAAGEAAKRKRDEGKQPLTGFDQQAISREDQVHQAQEQIKAQRDLIVAMGQSADAVQGGFHQMVAMHQTGYNLTRAVTAELATIHASMRALQSQIDKK